MTTPEIKVVPDPAAFAAEGAQRFVDAAIQAIAINGRFCVALSGGHTPQGMFELLTREPYRSQVAWEHVEVYFGDERCVPPDSDQSNYRMAHESLLKNVPIPAENIHRIRGEIDPQDAAKEYGQLLEEKFADEGLDLVLLGMGPDGHTASLFPCTEALHESKHRCVANFVPKLNASRVTLSASFINRSDQVVFLVAGSDKAERLVEVLEGPRDPDRLPSQLIAPEHGKLVWIIDAAAAGMQADS
jgi:6-phosphogluconolactonase